MTRSPSPPPPAPVPKPKPTGTIIVKPIGSLQKAGPAPKANAEVAPVTPTRRVTPVRAPASEGTSMSANAPTFTPTGKRTIAAPLTAQLSHDNIITNQKRKAADMREQSTEAGSDNADESLYLAGRMVGLHSVLNVMEATCASMRKELNDIEGRISDKRSRRR